MNYSLIIIPPLIKFISIFLIYLIFFFIPISISNYSVHNGIFPIYFNTRFNLLNYIYIFFIFLPNPFFSLNFLISLLFICTTLYHHLHSILNLFFIFIIQIFYLPSSTIFKSHNNLDTPPCILLNNSTPTTIFSIFIFLICFISPCGNQYFFILLFL